MASHKNLVGFRLIMIAAAIATLLASALVSLTLARTVMAGPGGGGLGNCSSGSVKDDSAPFSITAPTGTVFTSVFVKAGTECTEYTADGTYNNCYTISGLGTATVTVTGGGTSRDCKAISHIEGVTGEGPGPSPSPSASPDPSPDPSPSASPDPSPGP